MTRLQVLVMVAERTHTHARRHAHTLHYSCTTMHIRVHENWFLSESSRVCVQSFPSYGEESCPLNWINSHSSAPHKAWILWRNSNGYKGFRRETAPWTDDSTGKNRAFFSSILLWWSRFWTQKEPDQIGPTSKVLYLRKNPPLNLNVQTSSAKRAGTEVKWEKEHLISVSCCACWSLLQRNC